MDEKAKDGRFNISWQVGKKTTGNDISAYTKKAFKRNWEDMEKENQRGEISSWTRNKKRRNGNMKRNHTNVTEDGVKLELLSLVFFSTRTRKDACSSTATFSFSVVFVISTNGIKPPKMHLLWELFHFSFSLHLAEIHRASKMAGLE